MSDPRWSPPGDATADDAGAPPPPPADGVGEPPPPPPPPGAGIATYGSGGWEPPSRTRRTGLIVAIVVAIVAIPLVLGGIALVAVRDAGPESGSGAQEVPPDDEAAQAQAVLEAIDQSEERMIAFQQEVFEAVGQDGTVGDAAEEVARAAQAAGNDLTELRSGLRAMADAGEGGAFDAIREVRDSYAEHMAAWIDYVDAVAGDPRLAGAQAPEADPHMEEINASGERFVEAVEGLPDDLPDRVLDLAETIVDRGFTGSGQPSGNLVHFTP